MLKLSYEFVYRPVSFILFGGALFFIPHGILAILATQGLDPNLFDPAVSKLGGMSILTIHMGIMAQMKRFFLLGRRRDIFDFMNYPLAFILVLPVLPPWPVWSYAAWTNYIGGGVALAVLASVTAQKVRDAVPKEEQTGEEENDT